MAALDLEDVRVFVLVADLGGFTRAADSCGSTQAAVSQRVKRLELRLGRRLVDRTPRLVRLTAAGEDFLPRARALLAALERALAPPDAPVRRLSLGISDHVAGPEFPGLLRRLARHDPGLGLDVRIATSQDLLDMFDLGDLEAVVVRQDSRRRDGELLFEDGFGWFAAAEWRRMPDQPLPLVTLSTLCGIRSQAIRLLTARAIPWREAFVGGGTAAVAAAVEAGLGVAPLARRVAPPGLMDVERALGLPPLPVSPVMLHSRVSETRAVAALRLLAAAFRAGGNTGQV